MSVSGSQKSLFRIVFRTEGEREFGGLYGITQPDFHVTAAENQEGFNFDIGPTSSGRPTTVRL